MKHLKMLGLAAIAAAGLMAFIGAGTASAATELCSTNTNPCTGTKYGAGTKMHAVSEGHVVLSAAFAKAECNSTLEGEVTGQNAAGTTVGNITSLTFTNCTSPCTSAVTTANGSLEIHTQNATSNGNGTLTAFNTKVTVTCAGIPCVFGAGAAGIDVGTVTGGNPATVDVNTTVKYIEEGSNFLCTAGTGTGGWKGSYEITSPKPLFVI